MSVARRRCGWCRRLRLFYQRTRRSERRRRAALAHLRYLLAWLA